MSADKGEFEEVQRGMLQIIDAFRAMMRIEQGSGGVTPMGTAFVVANGDKRYVITADHVLDGPEEKFLGIDESGSVRWPRRFSRLEALQDGLPDADVAWATLEPPQDVSQSGASIPFGLASAKVHDAPGSAYLVVGQPSSKSKMLNAHTVLSSKIMQSSVEIAPDSVTNELIKDRRVQMALSYSGAARRGVKGKPPGLAHPRGMSGGAVIATVRMQRKNGEFSMIPFVVGVLTGFSEHHDTYVATRIEHIWAAIGIGSTSVAPLYRRVIGTFRAQT